MIGYEAIDILQETLKESPFWKFVQPLFGGVEIEASVAMDVADANVEEATYDPGRKIITPDNAAELLSDVKQDLVSLREQLVQLDLKQNADFDKLNYPLTYDNIQRLIAESEQAIKDIELIQKFGVGRSEYPEARLVYDQADNLKGEMERVTQRIEILRRSGVVFASS